MDDVYSAVPFVPLGNDSGSATGEKNEGRERITFPANSIITHDGTHWLFYEGRAVGHDERFTGPGYLGVARWPYGRFAGMKSADALTTGHVLTRPFVLHGRRLLLDLEITEPGGECTVELLGALGGHSLSEHEQAAEVGRVLLKSEPLRVGRMLNQTGSAIVWVGTSGRRTTIVRSALSRGRQRVRLRFRLSGSAVLYAFRWSG